MENGPFIDDFPIKASIYKGFSMAMLNNQMDPDGKHVGLNHIVGLQSCIVLLAFWKRC